MKRFSIVLFILLAFIVTACAPSEPAAPVPTRTPRPTDAIPPTWTPALTETPEPTRTPEPETQDLPAGLPRATAEALFLQEGEVLSDGWMRYTVPDAMVAVSVPSEFYAVRLDSDLMSAAMEQGTQILPEEFQNYDFAALAAQSIRLMAVELETGATVNVTSVNLGEIPLETILTSSMPRLDQMGITDRSEPEYFIKDGYEAARIRYYLPLQTGVVLRGQQLFIVSDGVFQSVTVTYPSELEADYDILAEQIFDRVEVIGGVTS